MNKLILITVSALLFGATPTLCAASTAHTSSSKAIPTEAQIEEMEKKLIDLINQERIEKGLPALRPWKPLTLVARNHSQEMAEGKVAFGHDGFKERYATIRHEHALKLFGENVAYNYKAADPLDNAVTGWMNSKGHRENILGKYQLTGIGIAVSEKGYIYYTQLFATLSKD